MKYHVNMRTGNVNPCHAAPGRCPLKGDDGEPAQHFNDEDDARKMYEDTMQRRLFSPDEPELSYRQMIRRARRCIAENPVLSDLEEQHGLLTSSGSASYERRCTIAEVLYRNRMYEAVEQGKSDDVVNGYRRLSDIAGALMKCAAARDGATTNSGRLDRYVTDYFMMNMTRTLNDSDMAIRTSGEYENFSKCRRKVQALRSSARTVRTTEGRDVSFDRAVIGTDDDGTRIHLDRATRRDIMEQVARNGDALADSMRGIPEFEDKSCPEGFEFLGSGAEGNVYLHRGTMMVYKVPHQDNPYFAEDEDSDPLTVSRKINSLVRRQMTAAGQPPRGYRCLPTFPITAGHDRMGITAQPYMNDVRYRPYTVPVRDENELEDQGFYDFHPGNVRLDLVSGTVYMYDCLTWDRTDAWNAL